MGEGKVERVKGVAAAGGEITPVLGMAERASTLLVSLTVTGGDAGRVEEGADMMRRAERERGGEWEEVSLRAG